MLPGDSPTPPAPPLAAAAVVPVFNPEPGLADLCAALARAFAHVVVVDDGSVEATEAFAALPPSVILLRHAENRGKGRAIKTALAWLAAERPGCAAVFVDGDGQHRVEEAVRVAARCLETDAATLGVRAFDAATPFRSRLGNVCTAWLVRRFLGFEIRDTQTGLRAFPARLLAALAELPGERYDFEIRLFGFLRRRGERLEQVPIPTIYLACNRASHFRPLRDTLRNYRGLFRDFFTCKATP